MQVLLEEIASSKGEVQLLQWTLIEHLGPIHGMRDLFKLVTVVFGHIQQLEH